MAGNNDEASTLRQRQRYAVVDLNLKLISNDNKILRTRYYFIEDNY